MTTNIIDKDGNSIDASDATVPSNRLFRNAWSLSGTVITEDLTASKVIFKDKIRQVRKLLLEAEDIVYMKALDTSCKYCCEESIERCSCSFSYCKCCKHRCIKISLGYKCSR
jgi:hypothetical protein